MEKIKVGVVGCGYWGPNLIRNFSNSVNTSLKWLCDLDNNRLEKIKNQYPHVNRTVDFNELLADDDLDAIVIATPVNTHFTLAKKCLDSGKHV